MTPAKLKRLRRVLDALKQADMVRLAHLRHQEQAALARADLHRTKARVTHPVADAADLRFQNAWARAELRRADAEDLAREALSVPVAEAAAQLARTFGREAALAALSERLDIEQARLEERKAEAALTWMHARKPGSDQATGSKDQAREPSPPASSSSSTGVE
ncbi:MAG: hypothetical protein AAFV19_16075 [Pseudomonadota bacterium]